MCRSLLAGAVLLAGQPLWGQAPDLAQQTRLPIDLNAESSEFDRRNDRLLFRTLTISQGTLKIRADNAEATRLDFDNSRWIFRGNVIIDNQGAKIWCDQAELDFAGHQLRRARLTGEPARFEQQRPDDQRTEGHAGAMEYDVDRATIRLSSEAWISDGANEVTGERISYDLRREYVIADAGKGGEVRMKITPPRTDKDVGP
jgi:lipopolysaccharide transport protein LptA